VLHSVHNRYTSFLRKRHGPVDCGSVGRVVACSSQEHNCLTKQYHAVSKYTEKLWLQLFFFLLSELQQTPFKPRRRQNASRQSQDARFDRSCESSAVTCRNELLSAAQNQLLGIGVGGLFVNELLQSSAESLHLQVNGKQLNEPKCHVAASIIASVVLRRCDNTDSASRTTGTRCCFRLEN
jgi:hypothetical protein